jgi:hypothetical protein
MNDLADRRACNSIISPQRPLPSQTERLRRSEGKTLAQQRRPPSDAFVIGRALRICNQRSTVVYALSRTGSFRCGSRRQYDLDVPRGAEKANAANVLFQHFDAALREAGYLAMSGQSVDATIVAAPKQRNASAEKKAIKKGCIPED